jgi:tetratricopeptide (TPR) repeat protein
MGNLEEVIERGDRAEILEQFALVVARSNIDLNWYAGLVAARRVFDAIAQWDGFDVAPYALTVARFAHNYANALQHARLFDVAEEFYSEALNLFQTHGDSVGEMMTFHQLGRARQAHGKYFEAECAYGESLNLIAQARRQYAEARRWFAEAMHRAEQAGYAAGRADALHQLGMIAQAEGDIGQAERMYHASLDIASKLNNPSTSVPTLYQLTLCASARKDFAMAEKFCKEYLALAQVQGDLNGITRVRDLLKCISDERLWLFWG